MGRMARLKFEGGGYYHVTSRVAGVKGQYDLAPKACQRQLIGLLRKYAALYMCRLAAFCVMGNHWHAVLRFIEPYALSHDELIQIARKFYPGKAGREKLSAWGSGDWERFGRRIFDLSEFMRNVQGSFATWYNRTFNRRGRFWAERFTSTLLGDMKAVLDCMIYVELNPVRAGLVTRPEDYGASSAGMRAMGDEAWLMPVNEVLQGQDERGARREYRNLLYWRGTEPAKVGDARIPRSVARREAERGYSRAGAFLRRLRYFSDGLAVGTESFVRRQLTRLRVQGSYLRRRNPIANAGAPHLAARAQQCCTETDTA